MVKKNKQANLNGTAEGTADNGAILSNRVVIPGDRIPLTTENTDRIRVGPGLHQEAGELLAVKAGILRHEKGNRWGVESSQKRYVPALGDPVLGIITSKGSEAYRVDIGSAHPASLPSLAFEGVTKKTKPNLNVGTLIYARVSLANKDMEPELECINPTSGKAEGYGELKGGFMFKCSLGMARRLLEPGNPIAARLEKAFPFEFAAGMNGRIWINAGTPAHIIAASQAIQRADGAAATEIPKRVDLVLRMFDDAMDTS